MMWKEQFSPGMDFPSVDVVVKYAICSTPRSGSHFLGQLFYGTGLMGCPLEYFNRVNLRRWRERAGGADVYQFLLSVRTSPNGCFGLKAHYSQLPTLRRHVPDFGEFKIIQIVRRDRVAQAVSLAKAEQTGQWISRVEGKRRARYDFDRIRRCYDEIARQDAGWERSLGDVPRFVVEYEQLVADPAAEILAAGAHLQVGLRPDFRVEQRITQQRDDESQAWCERFVAESSGFVEVG